MWRGAECCALVDEEARRTALNGGRGATVTVLQRRHAVANGCKTLWSGRKGINEGRFSVVDFDQSALARAQAPWQRLVPTFGGGMPRIRTSLPLRLNADGVGPGVAP